MSVADDIRKSSKDAFGSQWTVRDGVVVPAASDLKLSNDAVHFKTATILYADLDASTSLVEKKKWEFAGQVKGNSIEGTGRNAGGAAASWTAMRAN